MRPIVSIALKATGCLALAVAALILAAALYEFSKTYSLHWEAALIFFSAAGLTSCFGLLLVGIAFILEASAATASNTATLLRYIAEEDAAAHTTSVISGPASQAIETLREGSLYRSGIDPEVVGESDYMGRRMVELADGSISIMTRSGWRRFSNVEAFETRIGKGKR